MLLALSVISENAAALGAASYKVFDERGGTIGRVNGNDWMLPDALKFVSSRHASIHCKGGRFLLEDTSTNGTFVNAPDRPAGRNQLVELSDGDRLFIGEYEILVQLIEDAMSEVPTVEPAYEAPTRVQTAPITPSAPAVDVFSAAPSEPLDPLSSLLGQAPSSPEPPGSGIPSDYQITGFRTPAARSASAVPQAPARPAPPAPEPFAPRAPAPEESHDPLAGLPGGRPEPAPPVQGTGRFPRPVMPPAAPTPPPRPAPAQHGGGSGGVEAELLSALGIDPAQVDPSMYSQLGAIVRIVVQGMIDVLQSRAEIKNNFRMPMTSIRPVENNPLKFSMNAEDALHNLFVKRNPGYLTPIPAFQEAFQDITFHQMAMLAGIRAAYDAMVQKLHPDRLEEIFDRKLKRTALLNVGRQSKFWDLYREQFEDIDRDAEAHFQLLFGEEFAKAYNEQLARLGAAARARHR